MGRKQLALAVAGVVALSVGPLAGGSRAATLDPKNLPNAMHASVEDKAIILGTGSGAGLAVILDPGPAYSLANIDYSRFADDIPADVAMKARGAILDPGTIGGAVLWAPPAGEFADPDLNSDGKGDRTGGVPCNNDCELAPTGMHEAAGFPGYAEAFYPNANGIDRQHTAKCLINKDANEANPTGGAIQTACRNDAEATPFYAVADTFIDDLHSRGFSRAAGATASSIISVGASEALSDVRPTTTGKLIARGYAAASNISLANGVVQIGAVRSSAEIDTEPGAGAPDVAKASCTVSGVQVAGVDLPVDAGTQINPNTFKPLHDAALARGFDITILPPSKPTITTDQFGKHTATCVGMRVFIDDLSSQIKGRLEYTFGFIEVKASSNTFQSFETVTDSTDSGSSLLGAAISSDSGIGGVGATPFNSPAPSAFDTSALSGSSSSGSSTGSNTSKRRSSGTAVLGAQTARSLGGQKPISKSTVVALTTGTSAMIGLSVWLLIGVVMALASGTPLRLPGTRIGR